MTLEDAFFSSFPHEIMARSLLSRSSLVRNEIATGPGEPLHCDSPALRNAEIAAVYLGQRVAGDFYEFLRVGPSRMLFVLLDIAGLRADTREILTALRKTFRTGGPGFSPQKTSTKTPA